MSSSSGACESISTKRTAGRRAHLLLVLLLGFLAHAFPLNSSRGARLSPVAMTHTLVAGASGRHASIVPGAGVEWRGRAGWRHFEYGWRTRGARAATARTAAP